MQHPTSRPAPAVWISLLALVAVLGATLSACSDEPGAPVVEQYLPIEGGSLPQVVFEGEVAELRAWGAVDQDQGAFQSLEVEVLSHPGREPGEIEVRALANPTSPSTAADFESGASLPPLQPGDYRVRFVGRGFTRTLSVLSRSGWVRYRSRHDPMSPDEGLLIGTDGMAMAYRVGAGRSEKTQLSRERMAEIGSWFQAIDFASLEHEYLSGDRNRMRVIEIALTRAGVDSNDDNDHDPGDDHDPDHDPGDDHDPGHGSGDDHDPDHEPGDDHDPGHGPDGDPGHGPGDDPDPNSHSDSVHRVVAEEDLMPPGFARLASQLGRLVDELLEDRPPYSRIVGKVTVDPIEADPGVTRRIEMTLVNEGAEPITLEFPSAQQYDFWLMRTEGPRGPNGDSPDTDPDSEEGDQGPGRMRVWNWAHGLSFPEILTRLTLEPGRVHTVTAEWNGLDNRQNEVGPGVYVMTGVLPSLPHDLAIRIHPMRLVVKGQVPNRMPLIGTLSIVPATAPHGTPRQITLAITNLNRTAVEREFIDTQRFDLAIYGGPTDRDPDPDGRTLIWQWSEGEGFGDMYGTVIWAPGETHTYVETWDGNNRRGTAVGQGHYGLRGWITSRRGASVRPVSVVVSE